MSEGGAPAEWLLSSSELVSEEGEWRLRFGTYRRLTSGRRSSPTVEELPIDLEEVRQRGVILRSLADREQK